MKLFKTLSTLTVALLTTTFANAQTMDVTTAELAKTQPISAVAITNTLDSNLASSMLQLKVTLASVSFNSKDLLAAQVISKRDTKQLESKVTLDAE